GSDYAITGGTSSADAQNLFHSFEAFNLLTGESATFITDPSVLNILSRVSGGDASIIDGLLQVSGSDANLFLINPNGILFGPNSALNLQGGFTAITADQVNFATGAFGTVGTPDYAALVGEPDSFSFSLDAPGNVVNAGTWSVPPGQTVVLMGGQVLNTGTIAAPGGDIVISTVEGNSLVRIEQVGSLLNLEVETLPEALATSTETFTPLSLPQLLTGSAIASATNVTVNPDGTIALQHSDTAIPAETGTAIASGSLTTSGHQGGTITVTGTTVGLLAAVLDASGQSSGGTIRIGGDYQGEGSLPTAAVTFVDGTSTVVADAIANGDGGRIILWSDTTTRSYGTLSARGGPNSGNGGFIETSSRGFLETQGVPDVSAPNGTGGTWLLDPFDIEIVDDSVAFDDAFPNGNPFIAESSPAQIGWLDIEAALNADADVVVSTGTGGDGNGDIRAAAFDLTVTSNDSTLQLRAAGDIEIAGLTSSGEAVNFDFQADTDNNGRGQIRVDGLLDSAGGDITLQGANAGEAPGIMAMTPILSSGGDVTLLSSNADIEINSINAGGGEVTITTPRFIRILGTPSIETLGGAAIRLNHGGEGEVPFVVGDASRNGTAGLVSNETDTLPPGAYFGTTTVGTIESRTDGIPPDDFECVSSCDDPNLPDEFDNDDALGEDDPNNDPTFQDDTGGEVGFEDEGLSDHDAGNDPAGEDFDEGDRTDRASNTVNDDDLGEGNDGGDRTLDNNADDRDSDSGTFEDDDFANEDRDPGNDDSRSNRNQPEEDDFEQGGEFDDDDFEDGGRQGGRDRDFDNDFNDLTYDQWAFEDTFYADDFVNFFDLPAMPDPDVVSSQDTLQVLSQQLGISSALVYARFVPAGDAVAQQTATKQLQNPQPTDVLQLVLVTPSGQPQQIIMAEANREDVVAAVRQLQRELTDRTRRRLTTYLSPSQQLYDWLVRPLAAALESEDISHLSFIMAPGLRSLPLAALHDGDQFIIENYTVGLMPSLALTDTRYTDLREMPVLAMGASRFIDQPDLPAVPFELNTIIGPLRQGERNLNETFTPRTLVSLREESDYRILHLATHGEFRPGGPSNSYIQFWDQRLGLDQLRQLQLNDPPLELLVMSACRTALGDPSAELGFAGLAVQAGVKSALATLWQVSDLETAGLMTEFYTQLNQQTYKAEALRQAQLAMLRGEVVVQDGALQWSGGTQPLPENLVDLRYGNTRHPYYWAAFTLVGSPW
ncbi:CHAT domain-containing protein, partial [Oscillatoria sp. CS-180]|uniref:CHAT domain-containing protein n=1 Tax=Oscillatoria sp. CS-180 TaxID=3021720 RepID=UPI00232D70BC